MFDVISQIVLTGICLLLRPDAATPPEAAVFLDGRNEHAVHNVYLVVDYELYEVTSSTGNPIQPEIGDGGKNYYVIQLENNLIEVASIVTDGGLDDSKIDKVPHLGKAWPRMIIGGGHKEVKELHQPKRDPRLVGYVNSRLQLTHGTLKVTYADPDLWRFAPGVMLNPTYELAIPQEVTLESNLVEDSLRLAVRDIDDLELKYILTIKPLDANTTEIRVLLANVPKTDLFPTDVCRTEVVCEQTPDHPCCTDHHFKLYYKAFSDQPGNPPIPHKLPKVSALMNASTAVKLFRVGGANCGPAQQP
jgi:hypothetical protein